jgi:uncharacterized membrane protein HdeD (DUF308 family)
MTATVTGSGATGLSRDQVNAFRIAFGILGAISLILGVLLLIWPGRTIASGAALIGIYLLATAIVRLAVATFAQGLPASTRTFDIIVGLILLVLGIFTLRNLATSSAALLLVVVIVIGTGWIAEGVYAVVQFRDTPAPVWSIVAGILSVISGVVVLVVPGISAAFLIVFSAIVLIVLGIVGLARAISFGAR